MIMDSKIFSFNAKIFLMYQQISFQRGANASLFGIRAGFCKIFLIYQQISFQRGVNASLFGIRAGFCKAPKGFLSCYLSDPSFTFTFTENRQKH